MSFMPVSNQQLKQEIGLSTIEESGLNDLLIEERELKLKLKELQSRIKERKDVVTEILLENDIQELPLGNDFKIQLIKGSSRRKVMSAKDIEKKYPKLLIDYPDLITTVKTKPQMRITNK